MPRNVRTIPATRNRFNQESLQVITKRKVAGYARVSTDHEDQQTSYAAQIDYYTNYIKGRDDWEFVDVYTDEGISATSTKHRDGFNRMITDALAGKIDLIVTKSVSRFARNTVDSLSTIRKLKEHGTECYFEKENIWTFDSKGELLITIMSSLAQEESRSISENCTWGQRKRMADGKVTIPFNNMIGFKRGPDGEILVDEEEAKVVRRIYKLYLNGYSPHKIARTLTEEGIPTPKGKSKWGLTCVKSILTNEKYKGDALMQKVYTVDFLTKKTKKNEGEIPQYYVENNHEAIVDPETFEIVQQLMASRERKNKSYATSAFSGKIICGDCGGTYGSKYWHPKEPKYRKKVWQCNHKYKNGRPKCMTPTLEEPQIEKAFLSAVNQLISSSKEIIKAQRDVLKDMLDSSQLEQRQYELAERMNEISEQVEAHILQNARVAQDQTEYQKKYDELEQQFNIFKDEYKTVCQQVIEIKAQKTRIGLFTSNLEKQTEEASEFSPELWYSMIDHVEVFKDKPLKFVFLDGTVIEA